MRVRFIPKTAVCAAKPDKGVLPDGDALILERDGDFGEKNAGLLVFDGGQRPEYVSWTDVARIDFRRPGDE